MKPYIWNEDGVLNDYTHGMICALANDLQAALNAVEVVCHYGMQCFPNHKPTEIVDLGDVSVEAKAWLVWGAG